MFLQTFHHLTKFHEP